MIWHWRRQFCLAREGGRERDGELRTRSAPPISCHSVCAEESLSALHASIGLGVQYGSIRSCHLEMLFSQDVKLSQSLFLCLILLSMKPTTLSCLRVQGRSIRLSRAHCTFAPCTVAHCCYSQNAVSCFLSSPLPLCVIAPPPHPKKMNETKREIVTSTCGP